MMAVTGNVLSPPEYGELMGWAVLKPYSRDSNIRARMISEDEDDEMGAESKEKWCYVKVNMDGVVIGRKVCILEHASYSTLALELEDMFGKQSASGLRLFEERSVFSLFYQDRNNNWRPVGDIPWKEFVDCVKRLRITGKDDAHLS